MVKRNWSATARSKSSPPPTARRRSGRSRRRRRSAAKAASTSGRSWSKASTVRPVIERNTDGCLPSCSRRRIITTSRPAARTPGCSCHRTDTFYREEGLVAQVLAQYFEHRRARRRQQLVPGAKPVPVGAAVEAEDTAVEDDDGVAVAARVRVDRAVLMRVSLPAL